MKNKIFTVIFLMLSILWISEASAQQQNRYVRKKIRPTFFVPNSALEKQEKLPNLNYTPPKEISAKRQTIETIKKISSEPEAAEKGQYIIKKQDTSKATQKALDDEIEYESEYLYLMEDAEFNELPQYKQKFEEYLNNLETLSYTGIVPDNYDLTKDLELMNSNDKIVIDDKFGIK